MDNLALPSRYDHASSEPKWQSYWLKKEVYEEAFAFKRDPSKPFYVIDTPPPFTSGEPHMGTVYFTMIVDTLAKYKRMKGYSVLLPQGWDTHGLPTELQVQYNLKVSKENPDEFREACRSWTKKTIESIKQGMISVGYRPDWEQYEYSTDDDRYKRDVQLSLLYMFQKGLIYRKKFPVYWCPHCSTVVSQAEVGYVEKEGNLIIVKFKKVSGEGPSDHVSVATTRPELLFACSAVLVNPSDERYKKWIGSYVQVPLAGWAVKILADEDVDVKFGTGAVMVATFGDEQDIRWQLKYNLPIKEVIDESGTMINAGELSGLTTEEAKKKAIELLRKSDLLEGITRIRHNVLSHTERQNCMTPIEFLTRDQFMVKMTQHKDDVLKAAELMNWHPNLMLDRVRSWHSSLEWDWVISRQRLFGTPLPFWVCLDCGTIIPAGEDHLPVDPRKDAPPVTRCPACGSTNIKGVEDVADGWVDSSITPLFITGFFEKSNLFNKLYPVDVRQQGYEIIRTWFWYSVYRGLMLTGSSPFKSVLVNGMILAPDGKPMSKSRGNAINALETAKQYGADSLRYALLSLTVGADFPFRWEAVKRGKALLQKLWSAFRLISTWSVVAIEEPPHSASPVDQWILMQLNKAEKDYAQAMDDFRFNDAINSLVQFFWHDLCDNYLEIAKPRMSSGDKSCGETLGFVFDSALRLFSPFLPHITEEIYQDLKWGKSLSVHALKWPKEPQFDEAIASIGGKEVELVAQTRAAKANKGIPLGQWVEAARVTTDLSGITNLEEAKKIIGEVLRIKSVELEQGLPPSIDFTGALQENSD
ncbi:MAG: valine--tRNA ligase [Thermoprotei archaeon]